MPSKEIQTIETTGNHEASYMPYTRFLREKHNKPIVFVGCGTCGLVAGALKTYQAIEGYFNDRMIDAEIIKTGCVGICSLEPVVDILLPGKTRVSFSLVTEDRVTALFDDIFHNLVPRDMVIGQYPEPETKEWDGVPDLSKVPFFALQKRIVMKHCGVISPDNIDDYMSCGGYKQFLKVIKNYTPKEVCDKIEESGLRGRSGSGYLTGVKWKTALNSPAEQKYMICNAEESDPGAFMDRTIIEGDPHRVIEGIAIAAYSIGASLAFIYIRSEYRLAIERLKLAVQQAAKAGMLGQNIHKSGYSLDIKIRKGPGAYVCGEETALINSLEGKRGMPRTKPPYPANQGLYNRPTVVNNVETLANVPDIIENGPAWFSAIGTKESKGTKVFSITGKVKYTGLLEVAMGTTLYDVVFRMAGGVPGNKEFKALHIGGPSGCIVNADLIHTEISYEKLTAVGAMMGSGGLLVMDETTCIVDMLRFFMFYMRKQSCGKCIPCREGTKRLFEILDNITRKPADEKEDNSLNRFKGIMQLENLSHVMKDTSLCGLGQNAPNPVTSCLRLFADEIEKHIYDRHCDAGVCGELRHFYIKVDLCTGCTLCSKKCPEDAIIGTAHNPYFIVQEKCTGCGICYETCKFNAILAE